jgi:hypothetical protein
MILVNNLSSILIILDFRQFNNYKNAIYSSQEYTGSGSGTCHERSEADDVLE